MKFQNIHLEVMSHHKRWEFRASPSDDKLASGTFVLRPTVNQTEPFPFRTKVLESTHTKVVVSQHSPDDDVTAVEVFLICNTTIKRTTSVLAWWEKSTSGQTSFQMDNNRPSDMARFQCGPQNNGVGVWSIHHKALQTQPI